MKKNRNKKFSKKTILISSFTGLIILAFSLWILQTPNKLSISMNEKNSREHREEKESNKNQNSVESIQIPKPEGAISKMIKGEQWDQLLSELEKKNDTQLDNEIPQLNYAVDTQNLTESQHQKLTETLLQWMNQKKTWRPRSIIILSKVFSKMNLTNNQKKDLEKLYFKNKWHEKVYWIEASHKWKPCPSSTVAEIKKLLSENRNDLTQDFVYFVNQMQDQNKKNELISYSTHKVKSWKKESKNLVLNRLRPAVDRSTANDSRSKTKKLGKIGQEKNQ